MCYRSTFDVMTFVQDYEKIESFLSGHFISNFYSLVSEPKRNKIKGERYLSS